MELLILPIAGVIILLFAAVVRVLGTDKGYKVLFVVIALLIVLDTWRPGFMAVIGR